MSICITNTVCFAYLAGENKKQTLDILHSTEYICIVFNEFRNILQIFNME